MSRRSRKRPKRIKPPRHRGQRRQKLSKTARELYPATGQPDATGDSGTHWEDALAEAARAPPPRKSPRDDPRQEPSAGGREDETNGDRAGALRGRVLSPASGACRVEHGGESFQCVLPSRLALDQQRHLAVGDEVLFAPHGDGHRVLEVLPRRTTLSRPDPRNPRRERVIAANVDVVVQVVSLKRPPLRPSLVDRCLIAIERGGAEALLCVNKVDLVRNAGERQRELEKLAPYRELGLEVIPCSATTGEGLDEIRRRLAAHTAVLIGHSGVGKSSLLNALDPELALRTGGVSERDGLGRHTTTQSHLYRLPDGIEVIDTPGIREFGLFEVEAGELPAFFPEFEPHAPACRFNDCSHHHEPDCAVRTAAETGEIRASRYAAYLRILESLVDS